MSARDTIRVAFQQTAGAPGRRAAEKEELMELEPALRRGLAGEDLLGAGEQTGFELQGLGWK